MGQTFCTSYITEYALSIPVANSCNASLVWQVKRNKHKRIKVMSDDDSDQEQSGEHDRDLVANQIFGDDDDDDGPKDQDETSQSSAKAADQVDTYGDLDDSEESGTSGGFIARLYTHGVRISDPPPLTWLN